MLARRFRMIVVNSESKKCGDDKTAKRKISSWALYSAAVARRKRSWTGGEG